MAQSLIEFLQANGYTPDKKRTTAREYNEPTIEFYKSGQARLRGMENETLKYLVYHTTESGIEIFICEDKNEMKTTADAMKWRTCETTTGGDPNIRVGKPAVDFFDYLKSERPDNVIETRAGSVAWDTASTDGKRIAWEKH